MTRFGLAASLALGLNVGLSAIAAAQSYPQKPIHIVVPFAAGGITDVLARALGQRLTEAFGQQTVIENKPGANSQVGAEYVAKSDARRPHPAGDRGHDLRDESAPLPQAQL